MNKEYRRTPNTVSLINYHFIFCSRYRRKIFLNQAIERRFKEIVKEICEENDIEILTLECNIDHVYLFVNALPQISPSEIMAKIKGVSSRNIRQEFKELKHMPSLWTRSFFVSTAENISNEIINKFIHEQKKRG